MTNPTERPPQITLSESEGDPPITKAEERGGVRLTSTERGLRDDPELLEAKLKYPKYERYLLHGREYVVNYVTRHLDRSIIVRLMLAVDECAKYPDAQKYIDLKYDTCLRALKKIE